MRCREPTGPRVGIDSRHTIVDDAVDFIALPRRDTKSVRLASGNEERQDEFGWFAGLPSENEMTVSSCKLFPRLISV